MRQKSWPVPIIIGLLILAGGALYFIKISSLYLENSDRSKSQWTSVNSSERFTISYIHSIYKEPVVEEFQIHQEMIVLKGVRTSHPGILEYYGFEGTEEFHPMDRRLSPPFFRVGMDEAQTLMVRDKRVSFNEVGEKGDRIRLGLRSVSLGEYLFHRVLSQTFIPESR